MKISVTGHEPPRLRGKEKLVAHWLYNRLFELNKKDKIKAAYTGMSAGVDCLFALQCIKLDIPVYCIFPCDKKNYGADEVYIMKRAAGSITLSGDYNARDRFVVDRCDVLLAVWDGIPRGGTYTTIEYAKEQSKPIIFLPRVLWR